jgi:ABC-type uncharacterized transport system substrate-binding protein
MTRAKGIVGVIPVLAAGLALGSAGPVAAHPHVFADGHVVLDVNAGRELVAITNQWTFDAPFSAFAVTGLDTNGDGKLQKEELDELAETSMDSLQDYHFFTWATSRGADAQFSGPRDYAYTFSDGRLTLNFTMPLKKPLPLDATLQVEVFDPEYFVAYTFPDHGAVEIAGNAADCVASYVPPKPLDADMMARLAAIPAEQHDLPPALADAAVGLAHIFTAHCP